MTVGKGQLLNWLYEGMPPPPPPHHAPMPVPDTDLDSVPLSLPVAILAGDETSVDCRGAPLLLSPCRQGSSHSIQIVVVKLKTRPKDNRNWPP